MTGFYAGRSGDGGHIESFPESKNAFECSQIIFDMQSKSSDSKLRHGNCVLPLACHVSLATKVIASKVRNLAFTSLSRMLFIHLLCSFDFLLRHFDRLSTLLSMSSSFFDHRPKHFRGLARLLHQHLISHHLSP